ncbi:hypothetical protein DSO57_1032406 [Entomophthora muscae]|uniref:Uncharacterized protein n=1 Tax=Entomophthora muscae TaxID=34485 RepID=A0ACC2T0L0_9FUNG|nr:hypothetical protein DSO57_1032406 [Entomophthora muscae]
MKVLSHSLVKSLTCNNLDLYATDHTLLSPLREKIPVSYPPHLESDDMAPLQAPVVPAFIFTCTPWLLTGLVLMGLNVYFPQFSPVSSFWSSLRAAVPVLHWAASWWFVSLFSPSLSHHPIVAGCVTEIAV